MKIRELIRYTGRLLKGRRARTIMICLLPFGAELFFRCAEAAVFSLLLYFGSAEPMELFGADSALRMMVTGGCTLLRWLTAAPLMYAAAQELYVITSEQPRRRSVPFSRILLKKRTFRRSISAALWTRALGLLALVPVIFFGAWAYMLLRGRLRTTEVFLAANAVFLTAVSALLWLSLRLSFMAVPFLLARYPQQTAFRTVIRSMGFMRGRKRIFLGLIAVYLPQLLTIVLLPQALTALMTAMSLSTDIFIREDEYLETDRADSGLGKARNAGTLPHGKKRRVKAAADEA